MRTSPGPGSGIARVPSVSGLPSSVTKSAFCILNLNYFLLQSGRGRKKNRPTSVVLELVKVNERGPRTK